MTTEQAETSPSVALATEPPLHHGDLEDKIVSSKKENIRIKMHLILQKKRYKEIVKQRGAMIQPSLGYDDPDPSISKAAGANRDRFPGAVDH